MTTRVSGYVTHRLMQAYEGEVPDTVTHLTVCGRQVRFTTHLAGSWPGTTCKACHRLRGDWDARQ